MKKLFSLFILLFTCISFSQTNIQAFEDLKEAQKNYFQLNRESVYLHLNKTKFILQEGIWFTAYAYSGKDLVPHPLTTNLQVKLFDELGNQVASKVIYIYQGIGEGFFDPNDLGLSPGRYLIKASTHFMRNFKEDLAFHETIEILGDNAKAEVDSSPKEDYDLQLLPEGGHLLANAPNTVGVKLLDVNGKGIEFSEAALKNNKNEILTRFNSNHLGLSKFSFTPVLGESYSTVIRLKTGEEITASLDAAKSTGVNLSVNNLHPTQVILSINTNLETLESLQQKPYLVMVHQNGNMNAIEFLFPENKTQVILPIKKSSLNPGVNTITLFNEQHKPILERLVYKEIDEKRLNASVSLKKNYIDSLEFQVKLNEKIKKGSLSISVLPSSTKSYTSTQNTASAFFLKPYVKGEIENASYYFDETFPRKRLYDLDLLLLAQGWSTYEWRDVFNNPPKDFYASEVGFSVTGKVNNYNSKKTEEIYVKSNETGLFEILELDQEGKFKMDSLYLEENTIISLGTIKKRNDKTKKPQLFITALPKSKIESIEKLTSLLENKAVEMINTSPLNIENFISNEVLDTITLQGENINRVRSRSSAFEDVDVIDEDVAGSFLYIIDYIATKNYDVVKGIDNVVIKSRRHVSMNGGGIPAQIFLDGLPIDNAFSNMLLFLKSSDVDTIVFNKSGAGMGIYGGGGTIEITTKSTYNSGSRKVKELALAYELQDGFSSNKSFYAPKYSSFSSEDFQHYGVIHWVPSLTFENENTKSFTFLNTLTQELTFYIEGITIDGRIISEKLRIKP
ncbi:hypothetical protein ACFQ3R_07735 [Mesonia ostreae]|uniref:TonB-dependent receptor plug domain-containing protein n=1 Tax=Mesonia ostreae TaxID=861110 RepID=A0ABU2KM60_9FLAO|nr:hypothetical protein [Mesonia ostreae]MDT0295798.1 hypothetical protein [Mesonia ostreae]